MKIEENWTFDNIDVVKNFDKHVREQLPWYDLATFCVAHIIKHYLPQNGVIYDIGASTGNIGNSVNSIIEDRNAEFIAVEQSLEMAKNYKGPGIIKCADACEIDYKPFDVAVCFLVLMFVPVKKRKKLIRRLKKSLQKGGVIIILDKVNLNGYFGTAMKRLTLSSKINNKLSEKEIIDKELSLAGVQIPIELKLLGKKNVRQFFAFGEFVGYVIEKS
jgi:tRNA (cmo5U34)-methyltransferase